MSSGTDTSTSTISSEDYKKRKGNKKHKRKSEKKHKKEKKQKRHKEKKCTKRDEPKTATATATTQQITKTEENAIDVDAFGPALPPHLLQDKPIIGPVLPNIYRKEINSDKQTGAEDTAQVTGTASNEEEDEYATYGPMPIASGLDGAPKMSDTQIELEQRALELKLAAIEGTTGQSMDTKVREEWMLELPDVGLKSGLAALSNMKRTFYQGKERPDFSDRSAWTKTPQDALNPTPTTSKPTTVETLKRNAEVAYERQRDEEQEHLAKKHKKKHKRDESLLELHQKKLRKEQKKKQKELAESGAKPERRPFTRDVDLKLNQIDKHQTKQIVDKAKLLNTKFASGHTKYL